MSATEIANALPKKQRNPWKVFGITVIGIACVLLCAWAIKTYFFPNQFKPVSLSSKETAVLNQKLDQLHLPTINDSSQASGRVNAPKRLEPEPYSEKGATREISFSEREINAIIAHNTDMADKLAIDLSNNLASAKLIVPLDPDFPMFGGKTLNLSAGIEFAFSNGKPIVKLRGVSAWGVPVPDAWLGNVKNVDLVNEFGGHGGFWKTFADGIDYLNVSDGKIVVKLKE